MYSMQNLIQTLLLSITFAIVFLGASLSLRYYITEIVEKSINKVERYLSMIESNKMIQLREALEKIEDKYQKEYMEQSKRIFLHKTYPLIQKYTCDIEYFLYLIYDIFDKIIDKRNLLFRLGIDKALMESIEKCRSNVKNTLREYDNLNRVLLKYYTIDKSPELINSYSRIFYYFMTR